MLFSYWNDQTVTNCSSWDLSNLQFILVPALKGTGTWIQRNENTPPSYHFSLFLLAGFRVPSKRRSISGTGSNRQRLDLDKTQAEIRTERCTDGATSNSFSQVTYSLGAIYRRYDFQDWTRRQRPPRYGKHSLLKGPKDTFTSQMMEAWRSFNGLDQNASITNFVSTDSFIMFQKH